MPEESSQALEAAAQQCSRLGIESFSMPNSERQSWKNSEEKSELKHLHLRKRK